ncbi:MAG: RepB family DNA primase [Azonexus sp.]|nr:RepB family DNA primase [Azonexus sp.]
MDATAALIEALQRRYFLPDQAAAWGEGGLDGDLHLLDGAGRVRTLVITVAQMAAWPQVANLLAAMVDELDLPVPAVSVAPGAGYQVWLSLAEPVSFAEGQQFLAALTQAYLGELVAGQVTCLPGESAEAQQLKLVPALDTVSGLWSAYIDPSLGSMFADEAPGLEFPPQRERQAAMLSTVDSIKPRDFRRVLTALTARRLPLTDPLPDMGSGTLPGTPATRGVGFAAGVHFADPQAFLMAVMNDASVPLGERIQAAAALLAQGAARPDRG